MLFVLLMFIPSISFLVFLGLFSFSFVPLLSCSPLSSLLLSSMFSFSLFLLFVIVFFILWLSIRFFYSRFLCLAVVRWSFLFSLVPSCFLLACFILFFPF